MFKPLCVGKMKVWLLWFDSMGAKSSSVLVETPEVSVLIDPGVAEMQPSYPLPEEDKLYLRWLARERIKEAGKKAQVVVISHYHYDHHTLPEEVPELYQKKTLLIKNPNQWINKSQWGRARLFFEQLSRKRGVKYSTLFCSPPKGEFSDPLKNLPLALSVRWGDYTRRKRELLQKGREWFQRLTLLWRKEPWLREIKGVHFADGKSFRFGSTFLRFTPPFFHGIEFDRVGWVVALVVEYEGKKFIYSSDLQGPGIEDYTRWIIEENPDILILDGPPTYLFGFTLNRINLERAIKNTILILKETKTPIIVYDHHLLRDRFFRERLKELYRLKEAKKRLLSAYEWMGHKPLIEWLF